MNEYCNELNGQLARISKGNERAICAWEEAIDEGNVVGFITPEAGENT